MNWKVTVDPAGMVKVGAVAPTPVLKLLQRSASRVKTPVVPQLMKVYRSPA